MRRREARQRPKGLQYLKFNKTCYHLTIFLHTPTSNLQMQPLLMEVVRGLEAELETNVEKTTGGIRGVGERNLSKGEISFHSFHYMYPFFEAKRLTSYLASAAPATL